MSTILRRSRKLIVSTLAQIKSTECHHRIAYIPNRCLNQTVTYTAYSNRTYCTPPRTDPLGSALVDLVTYEAICSDTLEGLCEYFDDLVESTPQLKSADVNYSDGVLTVNFGGSHGTYVINRQSPNRQIWLSSPTSGPKRYDFVPSTQNPSKGYWIYKHDGITLHELLQEEIRLIEDGSELARNIRSFPTVKRGWNDISYNFLVSGDGCVYVGRGWDKLGAHTKGHNEKSICFSFIGDLCYDLPTEQQMNAFKYMIDRGIKWNKLTKDYRLYGSCQLKPTPSPEDFTMK